MSIAENSIIRICHVLARLDVGGLENGVVNLCNGHDRSRFSPIVCCVKGGGEMADRLRPDVQVDILNFSEGRHPLRFLSLARYFRRARPHIVHTHGWSQSSFDGVLGARIAGVPVVINGEHGAFQTQWRQIVLQRFIARSCDRILSVSAALKSKVVEKIGVDPRDIEVIHNGVDTGLFSGTHDTAALIREIRDACQVHIDEETTVIGCIGSLQKRKNQKLLLEAAGEYVNKFPGKNILVLIVGQGPDERMLKERARQLHIDEHVAFLGQRADIPAILSLLDLLVLPSRMGSEGLPNVILEALSSGVPVVATRSVGTQEIITDQETGYLLDSEDPAELAATLDAALEDGARLKALSERARKHIHAHFSLAHMIGNYEALYSHCLENVR